MEQLNIHMYVIGVGDDWTSSTIDTSDLRRFVARIHGHTLVAGNAHQLQDAMSTINQLEKTQVKLERDTNFQDVYQYFLAAALLFSLAFLTVGATTRETM